MQQYLEVLGPIIVSSVFGLAVLIVVLIAAVSRMRLWNAERKSLEAATGVRTRGEEAFIRAAHESMRAVEDMQFALLTDRILASAASRELMETVAAARERNRALDNQVLPKSLQQKR